MATVKNTETTTIGINEQGIEKIVNAIDNYEKNLKKKINMVATKSEIQKAIKGSTSVTNITKMTQNIENRMESLLNGLHVYKNILEEMKANYHKFDDENTTFTSTIGIENEEPSSDITPGFNTPDA